MTFQVTMADDDDDNVMSAEGVDSTATTESACGKKRSRNIHNPDANEEESILEQETNNPLYLTQYQFLQSLSDTERNYYFNNNNNNNENGSSSGSSSTTTTAKNMNSISAARRSEIWEQQSQIGTECINQYAWVTPNQQCLHILSHFVPLIEIGCGSNAYWCRQLLSYYHQQHHHHRSEQRTISAPMLSSSKKPPIVPIADDDIIVGYDISPTHGGKIENSTMENDDDDNDRTPAPRRTTQQQFQVGKGGPRVLELPEHAHRTLFLCYPDETSENNGDNIEATTKTKATTFGSSNEQEEVDNDDANGGDDDDEDAEPPYSMAYECLQYYQGDTVIHVGELMNVISPIIGNDTAPYGRTSSISFQEYLFSHYHCILQYKLPLNWLHTNNDYLTVWKRSRNVTTIVYSTSLDQETNGNTNDDDDDDDGEDEEVQYRHIPFEERLPTMNIAAPCAQHLWL